MLVRDRVSPLGRFGDDIQVSSPDTTPILPSFSPGITGASVPWSSTFTVSNDPSTSTATGILTTIGTAIKNIFSPSQPTYQQPQAPARSSDGIFGIPTTIALVGGGVLVVGLTATAIALKKSKKHRDEPLSGYRRKNRRFKKRR